MNETASVTEPEVRNLDPGFSWPDGSRVAVAFRVAYEGWSDGRWPGAGPMGNPLPSGAIDTNAISWSNYGNRRGLGHLLDLFAERGTHGTFLVSGVLAERYSANVRRIAQDGHEIVAHSYAMDIVPALLDPEGEELNIARTTAVIASVAGAQPLGWTSPRGTPSIRTHSLLARSGYRWHTDCQDDDRPYLQRFQDGTCIVAIPSLMASNDMPLYIKHGGSPRRFLTSLEDTLSWMVEHPQAGPFALEVTAHAHIFGRPYGLPAYAAALDHVRSRTGVWLTTQRSICDAVLAELQ